jgi:hypothetical protein
MQVDPGFRRGDEGGREMARSPTRAWIPAFAGMTEGRASRREGLVEFIQKFGQSLAEELMCLAEAASLVEW